MNEISELLKTYLNEEDLLFATSNINRTNSADLDIYAVVKNTAKSQTVMFYDNAGLWHEIFIDTELDLEKKLNNFDEIAINFLLELDFSLGSPEAFKAWRTIAESRATDFANYPLRRMIILEYRIKVIYSKYCDNAGDILTKQFLLNSLNYYVVNLLLLKNQILPSSPKRWIQQLNNVLDETDKTRLHGLIQNTIDDSELKSWIELLTSDLKEMRIDRSSVDNSLTFIS